MELSEARLKDDLEAVKRSDKDNQIKIHNQNNTLQDLKMSIHTCHAIVRNFANKMSSLLVRDKETSLRLFTENIVELADLTSGDRSGSETMKLLEDWLRLLTTEIEIWHDKLRYNHDVIRENSEKMKNLEQSVDKLGAREEELANKERKLTRAYQETSEDLKIIEQEKTELERNYEKVVKDLKQMRSQIQNLAEENTSLKMDCSKICEQNESIDRERAEKIEDLSKASYQIDALEERIVILSKEKKYLESLISK